MATIFLRTLIIYALLICALRLMGKRQIGELEVSELVTTLLISEIAALPIENPEFPILYAVVPIITLLFIEILSSVLLITFPSLKGILSSRPTLLVRDGKPLRRELRRVRISLDELISALRQKDVTDITEVDYAILEQNGQISVLKKKRHQPPDAEILHLSPPETGITHILIADGKVNDYNTKHLKNGKALLERTLKREKCTARDILLLLVDDLGNARVIRKNSDGGNT